MANATAVISVLADTAKAQKGIATLSDKLGSIGGTFSKIGLGIGAVGLGIVGVMGDAVKEASKWADVEAQLGTSTGKTGAAAQAAGAQMGDYAKDLATSSKATKEQIATAEEFYSRMGFTSAITKDATAAVAGLANQGISTTRATKVLSQALAAPATAMTKLRTIGVGLTQSQQDAINALAASGKTQQAQALLMDDISAKTKGATEAYSTSMPGALKKTEESLDDLKESVGSAFLPLISSVFSKLSAGVASIVNSPGLKAFIAWLKANPALVAILAGAVVGLGVGFKLVGAAMEAWSTITKVAAGVQAVFNAVMDANPIALVVIAIVLLIAATVLIITHWQQVISFLGTAWAWISSTATTVFGAVVGFFVSTWAAITTGVTTAWGAILAFFAGLWGDAQTAFLAIVNGAVYLFDNWTLLGVIVSHWGQILAFFGGLWGSASGAFQAVVSGAVGVFEGLGPAVIDTLSGAGSWLYNAGVNVVQGLLNGVKSLAGTVGKFFLNLLPGWIVGPFKAALGIHSPSRVFAQLGGYTIAGLTQGLTGGQGAVKSAMAGVSDAVTSGYATRLKTRSASSTSSGALVTVSQMTASDRAFFTDLFREFAGSLTVTDGVIASAASAAQARLVKAGSK
jgi:hypothetical protein